MIVRDKIARKPRERGSKAIDKKKGRKSTPNQFFNLVIDLSIPEVEKHLHGRLLNVFSMEQRKALEDELGTSVNARKWVRVLEEIASIPAAAFKVTEVQIRNAVRVNNQIRKNARSLLRAIQEYDESGLDLRFPIDAGLRDNLKRVASHNSMPAGKFPRISDPRRIWIAKAAEDAITGMFGPSNPTHNPGGKFVSVIKVCAESIVGVEKAEGYAVFSARQYLTWKNATAATGN